MFLSILYIRGITLANLPGDVQDIIFVLLDEYQSVKNLSVEEKAVIPLLKERFKVFGHQCSMFGMVLCVWFV